MRKNFIKSLLFYILASTTFGLKIYFQQMKGRENLTLFYIFVFAFLFLALFYLIKALKNK